MRYLLTDDRWAILEPLVTQANRCTCGAVAHTPDRLFLEAILYWGRTGIARRDLPLEYGPWDAACDRFRRWVAPGTVRRLFAALTADPNLGEVRRVVVDSTALRAHRHAAGSEKKAGRRAGPRRPRPSAAAAAG